jgi:sulfatase maturation enzyme AslB (radical SAM superfamily)
MKGDTDDPMGVQELIDAGASLHDIFKSKQFTALRKDLLSGIRNPACDYCWKLEAQTGVSPRTTAIENLTISKVQATPKLKKLDTMIDENCNLRCRMCAPNVSNSLRQDYNRAVELELPLPEYYTTKQTQSQSDPGGTQTFFAPSQQYTDEIIELSDTLEEIKFTGGEPTVSSSFWYIVNNIDHPERIKIHLTTNATKFNQRFLDTMQIFKQRHFTLSIDGTRATYEYIRYPANWRKIEANIDKLCATQDPLNTEIHMCSVMSVYNMLNLRNLVDWIIQHNWSSEHKITWKCIPDPHPSNSCLDVRWASSELLDIALQTFTACETDEYTEPAVQKTINYLQWCLDQTWDEQLLDERRQRLKQDTLTLDIVREQNYDEMLNPQVADFISSIRVTDEPPKR